MEDKIKKLIEETEKEMSDELEEQEKDPVEDDFREGYIRALELKVKDLKDLIKK